MTKGIDRHRFNRCLPLEDGSARIQSWPGGRARHIKEYISCHIEEEKPTGLIVQAGGNDLAELNRSNIDNIDENISKIANDVIAIGLTAQKFGVRDIFIGSVPVRRRQFRNEQLHKLNAAIQSLCQQHRFIYIDNNEITVNHLFDGVHLNTEGTKILANNYLDAIHVHYGGWLLEETSNLG